MDEPESLSTPEPLAKRIARHDFDRLIMLSDGVFSIAMTLLVLDVKPSSGQGPLLARLTLPLTAFAISFFVAALFWQSHKRLFARLRLVDARLTWIVLILLGLIALLPEATSLIYRTGNSREANLIYLGLIALIGLMQSVAWSYAALVPDLMDAGYPRAGRWVAAGTSLVLPLAGSTTGLLMSSAAGSWPVTMGAVGVMALLIAVRRGLNRRFG